jgi:hypothetical protein
MLSYIELNKYNSVCQVKPELKYLQLSEETGKDDEF